MGTLRVFDEKFHSIIQDDVRSIKLEDSGADITAQNKVENEPKSWKLEDKNTLTCSHCRANFENVAEQREHYKLDWHRYNLKQTLLSKEPIGQEEFSDKTNKDDVSSISGSDSDSDTDTAESSMYATAQGKILLKNHSGAVFSMYAMILHQKKGDISDEAVNIKNTLETCCKKNKLWTLLMLGGGHFAGAVFNGEEVVAHKTFHCYTVRAGQGGGQASRDNKSGGSHPKSAGASLRRYNEQSLNQHVKDILENWRSWIEASSLIIYRAAGPYNRSVLFGGGAPLLEKTDERLRTIPFSTRRATFAEVQRVHGILTQVQLYDSLEVALEKLELQKSPEDSNKRKKPRSSCINRAKSREIPIRKLSIMTPSDNESSESEEEEICELSLTEESISMQDSLVEYADSLTNEQRHKYQKKTPRKSKNVKRREREDQRKKDLIDLIAKGLVSDLKLVLKNSEAENADSVNEILDDDGNTLLHTAAMSEQKDTLWFLLENGANPCLKNKKQYTAYTATQSKEIRDTLKTFARDNPDKFNYNKAQIPTNIVLPEEAAERKKAQRKIKREKEKVKKKENFVKKQEEVEKERFLHLSDREKRALAAERRILSQSSTGKEVLARCFLCAADISGKVPFEYLGNRFCTIDCLKAHRMQHPSVLS